MVMCSNLRRLCLVFIMAGYGAIAQYKGQVTFTKAGSDTLTLKQYQPQRYIDPGWTGVDNLWSCAYKTFQESSYPVGFLYNGSKKLCTPVIGFGEPGTAGSREMDISEGHLYVFRMDCPVGFQLYETDGIKSCLRVFNNETTYADATSVCNSWGGYIVAPKTEAKLDLVKDLSNQAEVWVGLDDLDVEGQFVWQSDGSALTSEQISTLFPSDQPNNYEGIQDCVEYRWHDGEAKKLNDQDCSSTKSFICEA